MNSADQGLDCHATDITIYTYNNDNEMTGVYHFGTYSEYHSAVGAAISTTARAWWRRWPTTPSGGWCRRRPTPYPATARQAAAENYVYDGENLVLVLNSDGLVTERELTGPAVDQVFASEFPTLSGGDGRRAGRRNGELTGT